MAARVSSCVTRGEIKNEMEKTHTHTQQHLLRTLLLLLLLPYMSAAQVYPLFDGVVCKKAIGGGC